MFIKVVDDALERLLRDRLPLPDEIGDITFDSPSSNWSAQLSRVTVNLFLYDVTRSNQPSRSPVRRSGPNGAERRLPLPTMQLSYLVSAWAGSAADEHQLLGDVVSRLAALEVLPDEYFAATPGSSVLMNLGDDSANKAREIWGAVGGQLKASLQLHVTVAADAFDWAAQPPSVERVIALTAPMPRVVSERTPLGRKAIADLH